MGKVHASLFSGFGAADLAATWMGWDNAFWCEIDDFPRTVLSYWFPKSKGYGNIKETDFTPWRGKIDVLTGGFPCQPFSVAGQRKGQEDDRYLWPEMLRAIREIRPTWIIGENVGGILSMVQSGSEITVESQASLFEEADKETILEQEYVVETVCRSLEQEGYSVQPIVIPACSVEAPHRRDRVFFIAHRPNAGVEGVQRKGEDRAHQSEFAPDPKRKGSRQVQQEIQSKQPNGNCIDCFSDEWIIANAESEQSERMQFEQSKNCFQKQGKPGRSCSQSNSNVQERGGWRNFPTQSPVCRGNDGLPFDVVRLTIPFNKWREGSVKGYGNAIVPQVMYEIFKAIETIQE
ncbi:DNA cytosine methyltransferase [Parabacteroides sp.]